MVKYLTKGEKMNITEEMKKTEILIGKKAFSLAKCHSYQKPPSPLQMQILKYVLDHPNTIVSQKELEKVFPVSKVAISGSLKAMEKQELILRANSKEDKREKEIYLTPKSIHFFKEMKNCFEIVNQEMIHNIDSEELNHFFTVLKKMQVNLEKEGK